MIAFIIFIGGIITFLDLKLTFMKTLNLKVLICILAILTTGLEVNAQKKNKKKNETEEKAEDPLKGISLSSFKFRGVGPALTSGRISDFAVNPCNHSEFYVTAAAGGVWKTTNAGFSFKPVFENEGSYSIGCVTMDPNNHNVVWVGTGENNNQRCVSYGDGVYKSTGVRAVSISIITAFGSTRQIHSTT